MFGFCILLTLIVAAFALPMISGYVKVTFENIIGSVLYGFGTAAFAVFISAIFGHVLGIIGGVLLFLDLIGHLYGNQKVNN